jgi:CheY-like chemotaxis protein
MKPALNILLRTSEPAIEKSLRVMIGHMLEDECELKFTVKARETDLQEAARVQEYGLIVCFVNTIIYDGGEGIRFDRALDFVRQVKHRGRPIVIMITTFQPPGFATAAKQAGVDAMIDAPFTLQVLEEAILGPLKART